MRKIFLLCYALLCVAVSQAQLTGTKNIPGAYPDLATAITDLNTQGVGAGGVILNLLAGNAQTAPSGGYSITATGTLANPIAIQGNGNTLTASAAQVAGALTDAIFKLAGADYVTISGFTMLENAANTITAAATNNMTEWGIALLYATTTNGAQNITIQNNTIDLDRNYQNSFGIYSNSTHSGTVITTSTSATTTAGANSGLKVYSNIITDVNIGIVVVGPTAAADNNDGLDIGGTAGTGNTITNFGTTGTFSGYVNVSGTVNGILVRNTKNFNISYNTVTSSNGGTTAGTLRGIYVPAFTNAPTGTIVNSINNNIISVRSAVVAGVLQGIVVEGTTASTTTTLSINNNDFNTSTHTIAAASGAITFLSNASVALTTNINNNTFTNLSVNTTGSVTFISNSWSNITGGIKNVNGNSIVTAFNKTGAGGTVTLFTDNGSDVAGCINNSNNNNFSNITVTGATTIAGWGNTNGGTPTKTVTGNTFSNWTGGTSAITGLAVSFSGSSTVSGNLVSNISSAGAITGITSGSGTLENFSINTVHTLTSTGASVVTGMSNTGGTTKIFSRNKIYNLESNNAGGTVNGILVSSGTTVTLQNNLIGDLRTPTANAVNPLVGLNITGGTTVNAYYNTVYINGTSSGALFGSSAISASSTPALTLNNNLFINTSVATGATGFTTAYRRSTTTLTTYSATSNANAFYAGLPGAANLIFFDGTNSDQTLAAYKVRVASRDANSVSENTSFVSTTGSNGGFLHINPALPTQLESGGFAISGITDDYDADIRNATTPDIGADEGTFTLNDLTGPSIIYTALSNTLCAANRTITATITDLSTVNTALGTRPRIWFKKASNANVLPATNDNTTDGWKYVQASNAANPFNLTIDVSLISGGAAAGDVIQYFVVAQDNVAIPNVSVNAAVFATAPSTVALAAANFPVTSTRTYTISAGGLSGAVTIGATGTYPTLTGAGGLFAAINATGLSADLTATVLDAAITENGVNALNAINYGCPGIAVLTIKPAAGIGVTLTGSNANAIVKLNGADNVIIDGLNAGGSSLLITNTNAAGLAELWIGSAGVTDGANNITVKNTSFAGLSNTATIAGIITGSGTTAGNPAESPNNNITIQGCTFIRQQNGIYAAGNAVSFDQNMVIAQNNFGSAIATDKLTFRGLSLQNAQNFTISNNTISGVVSTTTSSATMTGISLFAGIAGGNIFNNKISDIKQVNTTGWGSNGIGLFATTNTSNVNVYNNFISDVASNGFAGITATDNGYGIMVASGGGYNIYYNTVTMNTSQVAAGSITAAINFATGLPNASVNLRNNILNNTQTVGTNRYAILSASANTVFSSINNNDYYTVAANPGNIGGVDRANLAAIQTGFGSNLNSVNVQPVFISATDFHLSNVTVGANWCLNNAGASIAGITTDIDGDTRNTIPDIGADEFNATGDAIATPATQTICSAAAITAINYSGTGTTFTWTRDNTVSVTGIAASGTGVITGNLINTGNVPVTVTFTITAYNASGCTGASFTATVLVNPMPNAVATPASQAICSAAPITTIALSGATAGTTYTWIRDNTATVTGIAASGAGNITGTLTNTTAAPVTVTFTITPSANGCPGTPITATVTVNVGATITPAITEPTTCVSADGAIALTLTGAAGPYSFAWTGTGVNPTAQNQTGLIAGIYNVTVTAGNGCSSSAIFTLNGPGGCAVCPIIGSVTTNPSPSGCIGSAITLTTSGLTSMGNTYGIMFKSFASPTATPYTGGTVLATVANGALTAGGTIATAGTSFATAGTYYIYAVLTPAPLDPTCRPGATATIVINPAPDATATPATQNVCSGAAITTIAFNGTVAGTTYNWTRNNTATVTGIAANGAGNITGTLTNTTAAPVTVTFTITPVANGCPGTAITAMVLVNPAPTATATPATQTICSGTAIATIVNSGSAVTGTTYNWTRDNTAAVTGIAASGTGNISGTLINTTAAAVTVTFTVTPTANGCAGTPVTATVIVNPATTATATPASQTICSGSAIVPIVLTGAAGSTFTWTRDNSATVPGGIQASGTGNISGTLTNTTTAPVTVTFTITPNANGCPSTPITATVIVNPFASAVATPAIQTACSGAPITTITLTSNVTGTTYSWTRNNTATLTGIAASGTGNISGTLVNTGTTAGSTTFTITPSFAGCPGPAIAATVTVNPTPVVTQPANQALCNGASTAAVSFASTPAGTTYSWTNNTTSIGLAAGGAGNIASFAAINTGTTPVVATITVTPSLNGCTGTAKTFTITVNPTATVTAVANQTLCTGVTTTAITFTGAVTGTTYNWTNTTPSIGLAAGGTGNIAAFTAVNTGSTAVTATITVTPTVNGCAGTARTFTITVNGQSVAPTGATASTAATCGPGTADLSVTGGALGTGASWKWYSGSCGGTLIGTGATITGVAVNGAATFYVRAEGTCNTTTCASVSVTVNPQPVISLAALPYTSLTPLLTTTITATVTPPVSLPTSSIVWYKDGVIVNGAVTTTLSGITVDKLGSYTARVTTAAGCTALSAPIVIKDSATDKLYVLPNPNNGQFKLRYHSNSRNTGFLRMVTIFDSKGAMVYNKGIPVTGPYTLMDIDIRTSGKGVYFAVVSDYDGNKLAESRVVVQ